MLRILESFLLLVFGIGILCEQYTQYRNNVSKKNLFLFITAIILMICVEARYACEKQVRSVRSREQNLVNLSMLIKVPVAGTPVEVIRQYIETQGEKKY